jgi:hypothetical protein
VTQADVWVVAGPPGAGKSTVAGLLADGRRSSPSSVVRPWLRIDAATLRLRLVERGSPRDAEKLARYEAFVAATRPNEVPPVPHHEVDNRIDGAESLAATIARIVARRPH